MQRRRGVCKPRVGGRDRGAVQWAVGSVKVKEQRRAPGCYNVHLEWADGARMCVRHHPHRTKRACQRQCLPVPCLSIYRLRSPSAQLGAWVGRPKIAKRISMAARGAAPPWQGLQTRFGAGPQASGGS